MPVSIPVTQEPVSRALTEVLVVAPEVREALDAGRPVVALESTLITHGFAHPRNLAVALDAERRIRDEGAVPATIAIRDGCLVVGVAGDELSAIADTPAGKATRQNLAAALVTGGWWGTTVAATMIAAHAAGIRVFATGGIGGVHRGGSWDVSADLEELARTPVAVVCAGPKAILDVGATVEYLETCGVPVISVGSDRVPGFGTRDSEVSAPRTARGEDDAARIAAKHWDLGLDSGVLICVPIPDESALPADEARAAIGRATADAPAAGIHGAELTPWLLARVAELTDGRSVDANAALIANNAGAAARVARHLTAGGIR